VLSRGIADWAIANYSQIERSRDDYDRSTARFRASGCLRVPLSEMWMFWLPFRSSAERMDRLK